jgi:hypothetical protein
VPFYVEFFGQDPLFRDRIICNEYLGWPLKGCFKARMNFLIVREPCEGFSALADFLRDEDAERNYKT